MAKIKSFYIKKRRAYYEQYLQKPRMRRRRSLRSSHDGTYYLYSTNSRDGYRVFTSDDMGTWTDRGYCLKAEDVKGDRGFWLLTA